MSQSVDAFEAVWHDRRSPTLRTLGTDKTSSVVTCRDGTISGEMFMRTAWGTVRAHPPTGNKYIYADNNPPSKADLGGLLSNDAYEGVITIP